MMDRVTSFSFPVWYHLTKLLGLAVKFFAFESELWVCRNVFIFGNFLVYLRLKGAKLFSTSVLCLKNNSPLRLRSDVSLSFVRVSGVAFGSESGH